MTESFLLNKDLSYLKENHKRITEEIAEAAIKSGRKPEDIALMAVTKTIAPDEINYMLDLGVRLMGENKVQELLGKLEFLNADGVDMHIIGHLQSNKVRKIIDTVSMIQSVDSLSLIDEISRQCVLHNKTMEILLEVNIGEEEAKTGLPISLLSECAHKAAEAEGIVLKGLMCVPPVCDENEARRYFEKTRRLYEDTASSLRGKAELSVLSMGMSSDFVPAIYEGATLVRVGSALFGQRRY